jgi:L-rhamnose-H+ transport protein
MNPTIPSLSLISFSAFCNAAFAVPFKLRRRYQWENIWVVCHLFAMIIIPLSVAKFLVPNWPAAISAVGATTVVIVIAFGFLWGTGSVTMAIGMDAIGISLAYAVIMGIITAVGAIIPMMRRWSQIPPIARVVILLGIAVCVAGVAVCGKAGMLREKGADLAAASAAAGGLDLKGGPSIAKRSAAKIFSIGLAWCVLSGVLSACNNLGFDFADRVADEAQKLGTNPVYATLARFLALYWGGYLAVLIFCGAKMLRNGTWRNFAGLGAGRDAGLGVCMALFHFSSQLAYGAGAYYLGRLGTTVGFAVMISASVVLANLFGFMTGEWKKAVKEATRMLYLGLIILIVAVLILAYGNSLIPT